MQFPFATSHERAAFAGRAAYVVHFGRRAAAATVTAATPPPIALPHEVWYLIVSFARACVSCGRYSVLGEIIACAGCCRVWCDACVHRELVRVYWDISRPVCAHCRRYRDGGNTTPRVFQF